MGLLSKIRKATNTAPVGWKTAFDLAREEKTSLTEARRLLDAGIGAKLVERRKFRVEVNGEIKTLWHYREIQEKREGSNSHKTDNDIERKKK